MADYKVLRQLGLSKTAVACYRSLDLNSAASVAQLAERLHKPRTGLYRVLKQLEATGFVVGVKSELQPVYFYSIRLDDALRNYAAYQLQLIQGLIEAQNVRIAKIIVN